MPTEHSPSDESAQLPLPLEDGRIRVRATDHGYTDLIMLLFGAVRITHTPINDGQRYERSWDYTGGDALPRALRAARTWNGQPETEPEGWDRASDGRRRPDGTEASETYAP